MLADINDLFDYYRLARFCVLLYEMGWDAEITGDQQRAAILLHKWQSAAVLSLDLLRRGARQW